MTIASTSFFTGFKNRVLQFSGILICFACFFLPLSTSLLATFTGLAVFFWLLSGSALQLPVIFKKYPTGFVALLLFLFMAVAVLYSPANTDDAIYALKKYRELFLFPIVISIFSSSEKYRELAENSFVLGCISLMVISYGMAFNIIPEDRYGHSIVFHITHNFFMAVLAFLSLHRIFKAKLYRLLWGCLFLAATLNLFYIAPGRTGMLVYICLILLFFFQRLTFSKIVAGFLLLSGFLIIFYYTSSNFQSRVHQAIDEVQHYEPGKSRTSIGQRFDWWSTSIILIKEKPILGHGTGSYIYVQNEVSSKTTKITKTNNPHNEYLFLGVQFGIIGVLLYLSIFLTLFIQSKIIPREKRMILQGVMIAMLSGCFVNSFLFDSLQGHFFLLLSSLLITADSPTSTLKL